jgi:hypothetical protein
MHLVPAAAVRLMKRRVLSRPGVRPLQANHLFIGTGALSLSILLILISQQPDDEVSFLRKVVRGLLAVDIILELVYDLATLEEIVREVNTGQVNKAAAVIQILLPLDIFSIAGNEN